LVRSKQSDCRVKQYTYSNVEQRETI